jgi:hypothetical protein
MRHWEFWRKEERESSSGVRPVLEGGSSIHFGFGKKKVVWMRTQLQRRGEVLYVTGNRLAWKQRARGALHEGGVVFFFFFFFFFDNSGSGRQKSPYIERLLIFGTWTIQPVLLV